MHLHSLLKPSFPPRGGQAGARARPRTRAFVWGGRAVKNEPPAGGVVFAEGCAVCRAAPGLRGRRDGARERRKVRKAAALELGVDELAVHRHLEGAATARAARHGSVGRGGEDGARSRVILRVVPSRAAVLDDDDGRAASLRRAPTAGGAGPRGEWRARRARARAPRPPRRTFEFACSAGALMLAAAPIMRGWVRVSVGAASFVAA